MSKAQLLFLIRLNDYICVAVTVVLIWKLFDFENKFEEALNYKEHNYQNAISDL